MIKVKMQLNDGRRYCSHYHTTMQHLPHNCRAISSLTMHIRQHSLVPEIRLQLMNTFFSSSLNLYSPSQIEQFSGSNFSQKYGIDTLSSSLEQQRLKSSMLKVLSEYEMKNYTYTVTNDQRDCKHCDVKSKGLTSHSGSLEMGSQQSNIPANMQGAHK